MVIGFSFTSDVRTDMVDSLRVRLAEPTKD